MDATFFVTLRERALGVRDFDQLPSEPVGEPLRADSPAGLHVLVSILAAGASRSITPLRDATCQSFPVWSFATEITDTLVALSDEEIDRVAQAWLEHEDVGDLDADTHELALLLGDLRQALSERERPDFELFVLLEEKAF